MSFHLPEKFDKIEWRREPRPNWERSIQFWQIVVSGLQRGLELSSPGRYRFDRIAMFSEEITSVVVDVPDRDVFEVTLKP